GAGCQVAGWREFPDHHGYSEHDFAEVADLADRVKAEMLVCTQKDLVKVEREQLSGHALWALAIEMQFLAGERALEQALERTGS
ncbi:MAG: tetraacyldisaccharide 4'-kinase, partial [Planctomycetes bacterium]|nr:tetraacyldisaccharide 4'-kinase [Planctomycetota bacterium]